MLNSLKSEQLVDIALQGNSANAFNAVKYEVSESLQLLTQTNNPYNSYICRPQDRADGKRDVGVMLPTWDIGFNRHFRTDNDVNLTDTRQLLLLCAKESQDQRETSKKHQTKQHN